MKKSIISEMKFFYLAIYVLLLGYTSAFVYHNSLPRHSYTIHHAATSIIPLNTGVNPPLAPQKSEDRVLKPINAKEQVKKSITTGTNTGSWDGLYQFLQGESLLTLLPKDDLIEVLREVRGNKVLVNKLYSRFSHFWIYFQSTVSKEERSLVEILGPEVCNRLLDIVERLEFYQRDAIRNFMTTPAFGNILGGLVCDVASDLSKGKDEKPPSRGFPVIGPLRQRINTSVKRTMGEVVKKSVGPLISRTSMPFVIDYIVENKQKKSMKVLNRNIINSLLTRKLSTFFFNDRNSALRMKEAIWSFLNETDIDDMVPFISFIYDSLGSKKLADVVEVNNDPLCANVCGDDNNVKKILTAKLSEKTNINIIIKL